MSSLNISPMGLGCMSVTVGYGPAISDAEAAELFSEALAAGVNHFDTAEIYKTGEFGVFGENDIFNEAVLGKALASVPRDRFTVATKMLPSGAFGRPNLKLEVVEKALDASLKRLGLEYIDLYYLHRMPNTLEELEDFMRSAKALVEKGKIRHVGLSEVGPEWLRKAHAIHPVAAIQQEWSVATRIAEETLIPVCKELGIVFVAYSPLARNLLTIAKGASAPQDWRGTVPRYQGDNFEKNKAVAAHIADLAASCDCTPAQLCLGWLYYKAAQYGIRVVPIPGTTKVANLKGNAGGVSVKLTAEQAATLEKLGASIVGERGSDEYTGQALEGQLKK